ncbi:helix-turn-helix transcriptional regulator [Microbacterium sp.]|uniref:helix-turn-helix transcriptional regulator n=1 Tax=Microbacterium sp. TaxID=51671 RepID=UPI003A8BBCB5
MTGTSARMLTLLSLLQTRRDWPGNLLAERLEVTPRTVRRDMTRLRELGYRITAIKGPDGGYRLDAGSELPPLLFDDEQAVAIAVTLQTARSSGVDIDEAAARALATVRRLLPSHLRHRVDGIRFTESIAPDRVDPAVLEAVSAAARDRRTLRFDYGTHDGLARRAEPHAVVARAGRWYLVARDLDRDDWRTYRLDRLRPRTPAGAPFTPRPLPAADARTFLAARFKGSTDEDRWPHTGELVIDLPVARVAPWVDDGDVAAVDDHRTRVRLGSWSWDGLLAGVMRFGAPFTVVGPEPLREAAQRAAARLAQSAR